MTRTLLLLAAAMFLAWAWRRPVRHVRPLASCNDHEWPIRDPRPDWLLEQDADWLRERLEGWL